MMSVMIIMMTSSFPGIREELLKCGWTSIKDIIMQPYLMQKIHPTESKSKFISLKYCNTFELSVRVETSVL